MVDFFLAVGGGRGVDRGYGGAPWVSLLQNAPDLLIGPKWEMQKKEFKKANP